MRFSDDEDIGENTLVEWNACTEYCGSTTQIVDYVAFAWRKR